MYMLGHPLGLVETYLRHRWGVRKRWWHYRKGQSGSQKYVQGHHP